MIQLQERVMTQEIMDELEEKTIYFRSPYSGFTVYYLKEDKHVYRILLNPFDITELFNLKINHNRLTTKEIQRIVDTYFSEIIMEELL